MTGEREKEREMEKLLSVIVPVYNVEAYLSRCVDSILEQSYDTMEVILVDDGSRDSSGAICDEYAARDSRVRVIHKVNGGLSSARNAGLDVAEGSYVTFVDSDDFLEPDSYGPMIDLMERMDADMVCAGRYDVMAETGEKTVGLCPKKEECITGQEFAGRIFRWKDCDSAVWDKIYKKSLFHELRYPLGKICEDVPVTYRAALKAQKVALWNRPIYNYFHRPGSITQSKISEASFDFCQHTAEVYGEIKAHYPQIEAHARFLRVRSLSDAMLRVLLADSNSRTRFWPKYREAKKELGTHVLFFLRDPGFDKKERVRDLLLVLGLYSALRPFFTKDTAVRA